jgi:hypothetical protein
MNAHLPQHYRERIVEAKGELERYDVVIADMSDKALHVQELIDEEAQSHAKIEEALRIWRASPPPPLPDLRRSCLTAQEMLIAYARRLAVLAVVSKHWDRGSAQVRADLDSIPTIEVAIEKARAQLKPLKEGAPSHLTSPSELASFAAREVTGNEELATMERRKTELMSRIRDLMMQMISLQIPIPHHAGLYGGHGLRATFQMARVRGLSVDEMSDTPLQ